MIFCPSIVPTVDVLNITNTTVRRTAATGTVTATFTMKTTGRIFYNTNAGTDAITDQGPWVSPNQNGTTYECFATVTVGSLSTGTTGSWLDLGAADQTWTRQAASLSGDNSCTFTLAIRRKTTSVTLTTVTITVDASSG